MYIKGNYCEGGYQERKYRKSKALSAVNNQFQKLCGVKLPKQKAAQAVPGWWMGVCWLPSSASTCVESQRQESCECARAVGQPVTHGNTARTGGTGTGRLGITQGNTALAFPMLQPLQRIKWSAKENSTSPPATRLADFPGLDAGFEFLSSDSQSWMGENVAAVGKWEISGSRKLQ